jgi:hypothetical protein
MSEVTGEGTSESPHKSLIFIKFVDMIMPDSSQSTCTSCDEFGSRTNLSGHTLFGQRRGLAVIPSMNKVSIQAACQNGRRHPPQQFFWLHHRLKDIWPLVGYFTRGGNAQPPESSITIVSHSSKAMKTRITPASQSNLNAFYQRIPEMGFPDCLAMDGGF